MLNFNDRVRQVLLLALIILLIYLSLRELRLFMPGLLGAITLYILSRASYFQLVYTRKWKKGNAAFLYIIFYLLILGVPVFAAVALLSPKISSVFSDPTAVINSIKQAVMQVQARAGVSIVTEKSLSSSLDQTITFIPSLLNSTLNLISNLITMLFFLYYLLYHGREVEMTLFKIIPLKDANTSMLASETKKMVKANAIGIPLISIIQGLVATLGYFIFGVKEFALWGFFTGVFAFFPVIGTMVVWVPLVIYMYVTGETWNATGLMFYSLLITGNIDYVARITIMKKMGNVHPVITVLGVLIGLGLFDFIGLIFGPLLVSYIVVLFRIYLNEFTGQPLDDKKPDESAVVAKEPKP